MEQWQRNRKEIEKQARDWQRAFDSVSSCVFLLNAEYEIEQCNKATENFLGKTKEEIKGHHCYELVHATKCPIPECPLATMKKDLQRKVNVLQVGDKFLQVTTDPSFDKDGNLTGAVHTIDDITEQKKMEEAEHSLMKAKSDFISMVTHELRSPMCAIEMGLNLILDESTENLNAMQLEILSGSRKSVKRLQELIKSTLDLQKLNSGTASLNIQKNNINSLIREVKSTMMPLIDRDNLYLNVCLDDALPSILFDIDKITQLLVNLISNAIKFSDKGTITITTASCENEVVVSVKDEGLGIEDKDLPSLFMPFKQLNNESKNYKAGSSGLGLSISKTIIESHGGKIWAESKVGVGSVFSFSLPID